MVRLERRGVGMAMCLSIAGGVRPGRRGPKRDSRGPVVAAPLDAGPSHRFGVRSSWWEAGAGWGPAPAENGLRIGGDGREVDPTGRHEGPVVRPDAPWNYLTRWLARVPKLVRKLVSPL